MRRILGASCFALYRKRCSAITPIEKIIFTLAVADDKSLSSFFIKIYFNLISLLLCVTTGFFLVKLLLYHKKTLIYCYMSEFCNYMTQYGS